MNSPAMKISRGLMSMGKSAQDHVQKKQIMDLEERVSRIEHEIGTRGVSAQWWMAQCKTLSDEVKRLNGVVEDLREELRIARIPIRENCAYFVGGKCIHNTCLCAEMRKA